MRNSRWFNLSIGNEYKTKTCPWEKVPWGTGRFYTKDPVVGSLMLVIFLSLIFIFFYIYNFLFEQHSSCFLPAAIIGCAVLTCIYCSALHHVLCVQVCSTNFLRASTVSFLWEYTLPDTQKDSINVLIQCIQICLKQIRVQFMSEIFFLPCH